MVYGLSDLRYIVPRLADTVEGKSVLKGVA